MTKMLVMNVNSKRQRRPNVRLGEIGDISAAWACGFSHNTGEKLAHEAWNRDFVETISDGHNPLHNHFKPLSPEFTALELCVSSPILTELEQNYENKNNNPISSEVALKSPTSAELVDMTKSKLNFSNVTRKCRDMKRRGRSRNDGFAFLSGSWSTKHSPEFDVVDEIDDARCETNVVNGYYSANGFDESSHHQTPTTSKSKEACGYGIYQPPTQKESKSNDDAQSEGETTHTKSGNLWDGMRFGNSDVNDVGRWLEDVGFGRYAGLFEMHEVDEEALPLLTLEDLKEMGVFSVGHRRKLYNAIQQLRGEE